MNGTRIRAFSEFHHRAYKMRIALRVVCPKNLCGLILFQPTVRYSLVLVLVLLDYNLYIPFTIKWVKIDAKYPTSTIGVHLR